MTSSPCSALLLSLALAAGAPAMASLDAPDAVMPGLDFQLANGQHFLRLSDLPGRITVVNFWRSDCPPCLRELPLLAQLARSGKVRVVTVALQRPSQTTSAPDHILAALEQPVISLHGPSDPRGLLARFGNPHGALPHTVVLDTERHACGQHSGELTSRWLSNTLVHCPLKRTKAIQ